MKTKKLIALILAVIFTFAFTAVPVSAEPLVKDSAYWENLNAEDATTLLHSSTKTKDKSFVLVYYSSLCSYSQFALPRFAEYAAENEFKVHAINGIDTSGWDGMWGYIKEYPVEYPLVMAYNHETDQYISKNKVISKKMFHEIVTSVGINTKYIGKPVDTVETIDVTIPQNYKAPTFNDVAQGSALNDAVVALAERDITSGYPDGTFKPNNTISRAEAATLIARAMGLYLDKTATSGYKDVAPDFWGTSYIAATSKAGILNGVGEGMFLPNNNVTYAQIIKMIVCMIDKEKAAIAQGGWPNGYINVANELNIIDSSTYNKLISGTIANEAATRGDVAQYIYNAVQIHDPNSIVVGGKKIYIGMPVAKLSMPDDVLRSTTGWLWYVYGTKTYKDFVALGVADDKVVGFAASGPSFEYMGYKMGDTINGTESYTKNLFIDKNANNTVHAVFENFRNFSYDFNYDEKHMAGESKIIFYLTNAFRVGNGLEPFIWSQEVATVARLHSQDMADRQFYSHYTPEGTDPSGRMRNYDIEFTSSGENIVTGRSLGIHAYESWVDSAGHRKNLLSDQQYLGVGGGYNAEGPRNHFFTQNFYSNR